MFQSLIGIWFGGDGDRYTHYEGHVVFQSLIGIWFGGDAANVITSLQSIGFNP